MKFVLEETLPSLGRLFTVRDPSQVRCHSLLSRWTTSTVTHTWELQLSYTAYV